MRTRLKDVAAKLNLSPALVSGVLNNRPHIWASEETRARIIAAAKALNYHPSAAAQALSMGKTDAIVFVYKRLPSAAYRLAYSGLMDALSSELQSAGYDLTVANFATQEEVLDHLQKLASSHACDAVVLWGREEDTEPQAMLLESLNLPFVVKGRHESAHPHWQQVDFDHEMMTRRAVEHLSALGHKRIAYLGFPHDEGFVRALRAGYIGAHAEFFGAAPNTHLMGDFEDEVEPNASCIRRWLSLPEEERPTGFAIGAGNKAWQALELCLAEIGRKLSDAPGSFSAAGITSTPFTLMFGEALVYQAIEIDNLARFVTPALIHAIDRDPACEHVHRFQPELTQARSLGISVSGPLAASKEESR
ncbi:MAG TPA: LacI family DNA-binding transcriptional regulator [Fimbriimonas sp.]|nr:LacI family DNA-binding transcriptional regulator [Fimbriimonas sp.]